MRAKPAGFQKADSLPWEAVTARPMATARAPRGRRRLGLPSVELVGEPEKMLAA